jgi:cation-transporting P-type ATPase C
LVRAAEEEGLSISPAGSVEEFLGRGVRAVLKGKTVLVGSGQFLTSQGVAASALERMAERYRHKDHSVLFVAYDGKLQGLVALTNKVRPDAKRVVDELRSDGAVFTGLISGDEETIVAALSGALGFDGYKAPMLPDEKAAYVKELRKAHGGVVMVGDGVNDALALAEATTGVSMGAGGSEVAIEASDISLIKDDLRDIVVLRRLSRQTMRTIEQNFWLANATNALGIVLGASGILSPVMSGVLHVGHTLGIMLNSSRLLRWEPGDRFQGTEGEEAGR